MPTRRSFSLSLLAAAGLTLGCNDFVQNAGNYTLQVVEVMRDDCEMLSSPEAPWDASVVITGQVVRINFAINPELLDMQLVGRFLAGGERFMVDGTRGNAAVHVRGQDCLLDQVSVHLEGTTQCATAFDGALRVRYESRLQESCACELWTRFEAVQDSATCPVVP
ncbi:hypothetical protein [Hyalangium rubrum]|uniref:Lipoprotein n=1 Tax=Hyalangium rubrum TaxID=3103134 RepID=A0ABU5GWC8_9BACT|nr:hypothetical protein [Hyalangium sp. s54d21]MDY7225346.1 hypothetical protein [Hyalangium sp. s54d21]